jgi:hypothetical protein
MHRTFDVISEHKEGGVAIWVRVRVRVINEHNEGVAIRVRVRVISEHNEGVAISTCARIGVLPRDV